MRPVVWLAGFSLLLLDCQPGATPSNDDRQPAAIEQAPQERLGGPIPRPVGRNIASVAFSPDRRHIVTGETDGSVTLWNVKAEQPPLDPNALGEPEKGIWSVLVGGQARCAVKGVVFSTDGKHIFALTEPDAVRVLDSVTGKILRSFHLGKLIKIPPGKGMEGDEYRESIGGLFLPGREQLVSCSGDVLKLWDLKTGKCVKTITVTVGGSRQVELIDVRPDGRRVLTRSRSAEPLPGPEPGQRSIHLRTYEEVIEWDLGTSRPTQILGKDKGDRFSRGGYLSDGRTAWFNEQKGTAIWDLQAGKRRPPYLADFYGRVAVSPDGKWLATIDSRSNILLRDGKSGRVIRRIPDAKVTGYLQFTHDGKGLLMYGGRYYADSLSKGSEDDIRVLLLWEIDTARLRPLKVW